LREREVATRHALGVERSSRKVSIVKGNAGVDLEKQEFRGTRSGNGF
jgi:hypothetical protein